MNHPILAPDRSSTRGAGGMSRRAAIAAVSVLAMEPAFGPARAAGSGLIQRSGKPPVQIERLLSAGPAAAMPGRRAGT
jgi:hypothetical protein